MNKNEHGELVEWPWQSETEVLRKKNLFKATLSTTNPTQTDLVPNPRVCLGFVVDKVVLG